MLRHGLLWLSERQGIANFLRTNSLAWRFASRFVAGEGVAEAVAAARALQEADITATADFLGESVANASDAAVARDCYLALLTQLAEEGLEVNVSVKPSQMGLDIDAALCAANVTRIVEQAAALDGFVRIDMESSEYTDRTLDLYRNRLDPSLHRHAGVVIQAALRRSADDVEQLIASGTRVRLCKGAYLEPPEIAFPKKADVDTNFIALMERLLANGVYPAIATHDERMINQALAFTDRHDIGADRYEFQMLYGVRRDLQQRLRASGARVRVYIPFGRQWYPYLMRRLAERPSNVVFILGNLLRESLPP